MKTGTSCDWPSYRPPVDVPLTVLAEQPCSYLPGRPARTRAFRVERMDGSIYHQFMDAGFRRSGKVIYQPICRGCRSCIPARVPVDRFTPRKSQRRCRRTNHDLRVEISDLEATDEKYALYRRYILERHGRGAESEQLPDLDGFIDFLYDSPVQTVEMTYRDPAGRLLAVGICDICPESVSTVYFYYDPTESHRGLGTFGALWELDWAGRIGAPYYYMGYWIGSCPSMQYKTDFRPIELLDPSAGWKELEEWTVVPPIGNMREEQSPTRPTLP